MPHDHDHDRTHDHGSRPGGRTPAAGRRPVGGPDGAAAHEDPASAAETVLEHLLAQRRGASGPTAPGGAHHE
jgi:hypothetical protein